MRNMTRKTLAEIPNVGKVVMCGNCDRVHFMFGRMTLDLSQEELFGLQALISTAVAGKTVQVH